MASESDCPYLERKMPSKTTARRYLLPEFSHLPIYNTFGIYSLSSLTIPLIISTYLGMSKLTAVYRRVSRGVIERENKFIIYMCDFRVVPSKAKIWKLNNGIDILKILNESQET